MNRNARTIDRRLFLAYILGSLVVILYIPYLIPVPPSGSDSYLFGYNNRAGIVFLLLAVTVGAIFTKGVGFPFRTAARSQTVGTKTLVISLLAMLPGCIGMYVLAGRLGGFGESAYGIDRAWLWSQGKTPYVDFEWPFGLSFLFGPLALKRLFSIDLFAAYYLFWVCCYLLGIFLLFSVVNLIDYPSDSKRTIFLLLYGAGFFSFICMGVQYTFLRYSCPLFFVLIVHKIFKGTSSRSLLVATLASVLFTIVLLLISPETAIAHAFACACIFLFGASIRDWKWFATFLLMLAGLGVTFGVASKFHILDTVKSSGGGSESFPITFAPHILLFFAALFLCACYIIQRFAEHRLDDNTLGLIAYSIPMTAAALARCDPGHVLCNEYGVFLASMFYVSNHKAAWKWYKVAFAIALIILPTLSGIWSYIPMFGRAGIGYLSGSSNSTLIGRSLPNVIRKCVVVFGTASQKAKIENILVRASRHSVPETINFSALYPSWRGPVLAPFGYRPNGTGDYLSNQVEYGHFHGFENANAVSSVHEKLSEIKAHPEEPLLLPDHFERSCMVDVHAEKLEISILFAFPYIARAVHPESVRQPICDYILSEYKLKEPPSDENFHYGLWRRDGKQ